MLIFVSACTYDKQREVGLMTKSSSIGNPSQALVVVENKLWHGKVGDTLRHFFEAAYPLLPAPEPMLDLKQVEGVDFYGVKKEWRTILFIGDLSDKSVTTQKMTSFLGSEVVYQAKENPDYNYANQREKWAKNQLIIYWYAHSEQGLLDAIVQRQDQILDLIYKTDSKKIRSSLYALGKNAGAMEHLTGALGLSLQVPKDFRVAHKANSDFMWLRKTTRHDDSHILIHVLDYNPTETSINSKNLLKIRNQLGKSYITSDQPGAYMETDSINLPVIYTKTAINNNYALEARGIWRMKKDFMGGPFLSYMIYDADANKVAFVDGFTYAPDRTKRKYIQRYQAIFESLRFL